MNCRSEIAHVPLKAVEPAGDRRPVVVAMDLGTRTGWAVRLEDGAIVSGTSEFRPGRFQSQISFFGRPPGNPQFSLQISL